MRKRGEFTDEVELEAVKLAERGGCLRRRWPVIWM